MEAKVSHVCANSATTPVQYTTEVFHCLTMSPFQTWKTMKGKVWINAST